MSTFKLKIKMDKGLIARQVPSERLLEFQLSAPDSQTSKARLPVNLALVIDRSGSMSDGKLEYVKQAAAHVLDLLNPQDRVAIVLFDNEIEVLAASSLLTDSVRADLKTRLAPVRPRGMTDLGGGWLRGCQLISEQQSEGYLNRALLLTDGQANQGITGLEELGMHARALNERGISTSTFGVGMGFNEHLLEHMANMGGGNFYFIEHPEKIPAIFAEELKELTSVTARGVELALEVAGGVDAQVLGSWKHSLENGRLSISLGDLAGGLQRTLYVRLLTPPQADSDELVFKALASAADEDGKKLGSQVTLRLRYASDGEIAGAPADEEVLSGYHQVRMAEVATEALKLERAGERQRAQRTMQTAMAFSAPHLSDVDSRQFEELSRRIERGLDEQERKTSHQQMYESKRRKFNEGEGSG